MGIRQDENALLQAIYEEYQSPLRRLARSLNVPDMELEDVVQETFISYFEKYSLTWSPTQKKAMLVKILKRKAIDCLRKRSRYERISLDEETTTDKIALLSAYMVTDPLDIIVEGEIIKRIVGEIYDMRQEWKEIAILYFLEQRTIAEICQLLGIPGTVCRSRIYRTRMCLKKILGARYDI